MPPTTANNGKLSIQPRFDTKQVAEASSYLWTFFDRFTSENTIPEWGNPSRVDKLREFTRQEPILAGALSSMTSKAVSLDWQITGGRNRVTRYQEVLAEADAGQGWGFFLDRLLQDYWQADQGGFVELGRHGKNGPVLGMYNLDAGTVQLLTSPKTPAAYYPRMINGAISGKRIPLEQQDFARIVDMPSADESKAGLGFCASSRALKVAQILMALYNYEEERLSDMPLPGIAAITGMTQAEVQSAFALYKAHREDKQQTTFKGVLWLAAQSSPINPIGVNLTSFSSLPDGFDKRQTVELYVYTLALDFGVDVREFWPASQTGATKAEAEVQAQKAKGKGFGRALSSVERMVNWDVLPEGLEFSFDQRDDESDLLRETIRSQVITNITALASGQLLSPDEARRWLVELEMAPEWLAETGYATVHGNANVDNEDPEVVEREEPPAPAEQATPPVVDQAVAEKARRARLDPGEDFVAINGAGDVVTLWSSRRVFAMGEKKFNPDQPRVPAGDPEGGRWSDDGGGTVMPRNARLYMRSNRPFTGPNGSKLVAYEHKTVEDLAYNEHEGYYSKRVSDWDSAGKCATCGRNIVHVYFVEHPDGKIATYGSEHLWQALGYRDDTWMNTSQLNKLRSQLIADQNTQRLNLEEAHEKVTARASSNREEVNRKFWELGGRGLRPEETSLMERDDGMMVRVFGPHQITAAAQQGYRPRIVGSNAREDDRRRFAELFAIEKRYDASQPRWPEGDPRGGQWRPEGGAAEIEWRPVGGSSPSSADLAVRPEPPAEPEPAAVAKPPNKIRIAFGAFSGGGGYLTPEEFEARMAEDSNLKRMGITAEDFGKLFGVEGIDADVTVNEFGNRETQLIVAFTKNGQTVGNQTITFQVSDEWEEPSVYQDEEDLYILYDPNDPVPRYPQYDPYAAEVEEPDDWPGNEYFDIHADLLQIEYRFQNQGIADELVGRGFAFAGEKHFGKIFTQADITIGKYTWATANFQYQDEDDAYRATDHFKDWCLDKGIDLEEMGQDWPDFDTVADVALFDVPGFTVSRDYISNSDAKGDQFKLGKAFMLDDDGHGNWDAVYDLSQLWGAEETPSREIEMSYYERMLAVGQLPLEFPDPESSGSSWARDARRFHESRGQR